MAGLSGPTRFSSYGGFLNKKKFFAYLAIFYIALKLFVTSLIFTLKKFLLIFLISFFLRFIVLR